MKYLFVIVLLFILKKYCMADGYDRTHVQKKFPGFGTKWIYLVDDNGKPIKGELQTDARFPFWPFPDPEEVVTFTLFTRQNREKGSKVIYAQPLPNEFDPTKPTKFVTHGWLSGGDRTTCISIKDGFLEKYDSNVIIMDWSKISGDPVYPKVANFTDDVGRYYGKFLNQLVDAGASPEEFHLVGHSLGAHVSGFAARSVVKGKVGRITGLDPASIYFEESNWFDDYILRSGRLQQEDAEFVDVIHTCSGYLGLKSPIGHADFYPNGGGPPQPGCGLLQLIEGCSHGRSWKFFAESLTSSKPFIAYRCNTFRDLEEGKICKGESIPMGEPAPFSARGVFYLRTLAEPPFVWNYSLEDNEI